MEPCVNIIDLTVKVKPGREERQPVNITLRQPDVEQCGDPMQSKL